MTNAKTHPSRRKESGVALLIAIFTLLLVTGVAVAMVMASGTESSLASNYRSSTSAYYAGLAGLEEARGRMLPSNPNFFNNTVANFVTMNGVNPTLAVGQVRYVINNLPGETVAPATLGNSYYDNEYAKEWVNSAFPSVPAVGAGTQYAQSVFANNAIAQMPGPMYKWVRITAATEQSLGVDVNGDGVFDAVDPIYYDPDHQLNGSTDPAMIVVPTGTTPPSSAEQVFQFAALAALPNGTQKIVEYAAAPMSFNLNLPSALTLPGPIGSFNPPNSSGYCMDGNDTSGVASISGCSYTQAPPVAGCGNTGASNPAIGVSPGNDSSGTQTNTGYVTNQIPRPGNYLGPGGSSTTPSVGTPTLPTSLASPAAINQELQLIQQNANVCLGCTTGAGSTYTFSNLDTASGSLWGSCGTNCGTTPQVTYVNGNLDISGSTSGSGILVVTGNLTYSGNSSWNGIILVIGNGLTIYQQNGGGNGQFNGAIFVANTAGTPVGTWGPADFTINGGGGNGLYYNSCWIKNSQKPISLKILSFREVSN